MVNTDQEILQARLPCPPPGDLPDPGIKPSSLMPPVLWQAVSSPLVLTGKPRIQSPRM